MSLDSEHISKTLSYWLRHRPDAAALALDEAGWAAVDAVLNALVIRGLDVDWSMLLHVVETNDKQRFELSPDAALIRARQGHSVSIAGNWTESSPPPRLFHGTVGRFLDTILDEGLKPMGRHHVHLSADSDTATRVAKRRGEPVVLTIDAAAMAEAGHGFLLTGNGVWLTAHVPAEFIASP